MQQKSGQLIARFMKSRNILYSVFCILYYVKKRKASHFCEALILLVEHTEKRSNQIIIELDKFDLTAIK